MKIRLSILLTALFLSFASPAEDSLIVKKIRADYMVNLRTMDSSVLKKVFYYQNMFVKECIFYADSLYFCHVSDSNGNIIESYDSEIKRLTKRSFDPNNILLTESHFSNGELLTADTSQIIYNEAGKPLSVQYEKYKVVFEYDKDQILLRKIQYPDSGNERIEWEYKDGLLIYVFHYGNNNEKVADTEKYKYDRNGRLVCRTCRFGTRRYRYTWDKKGNLKTEEVRNTGLLYGDPEGFDQDREDRFVRFFYDSSGNLLRKEQYRSRREKHLICVSQYSEEGPAEVIFYNEDGKPEQVIRSYYSE